MSISGTYMMVDGKELESLTLRTSSVMEVALCKGGTDLDNILTTAGKKRPPGKLCYKLIISPGSPSYKSNLYLFVEQLCDFIHLLLPDVCIHVPRDADGCVAHQLLGDLFVHPTLIEDGGV